MDELFKFHCGQPVDLNGKGGLFATLEKLLRNVRDRGEGRETWTKDTLFAFGIGLHALPLSPVGPCGSLAENDIRPRRHIREMEGAIPLYKGRGKYFRGRDGLY